MCMNPMKALPYAVGGLLGGTLLKKAFGGGSNNKSSAAAPVTSSAGTITANPSGAPINPYAGG